MDQVQVRALTDDAGVLGFGGTYQVRGQLQLGIVVELRLQAFLGKLDTITTFSETLANALRIRLRRLINNQPRLAERLEVHAIEEIGKRIFFANKGAGKVASDDDVRALIAAASRDAETHKFTIPFLVSEWTQVVDAWQIETWERYRDVPRLGRKTRLSEKQRTLLWSIFLRVQSELTKANLITTAGLLSKVAGIVSASKRPPFDFVVADEAQDSLYNVFNDYWKGDTYDGRHNKMDAAEFRRHVDGIVSSAIARGLPTD